jgi:hypothetical protein
MVIDNYAIVGSNNIADEYAGMKYGTYEFLDLNVILKNIMLK